MPIATHTELTEQETALQREAREFAQQRLAPGALDRDREGMFSLELYKEAAEAGFIGVKIPESLGGRGLGLFDECLVMEELAGGDPSFALTISISAGLCGGHLLHHGSDAQKESCIPRITKGAIGAWAITERVAGSHAAALECEAKRQGDACVINGAKMFVTQGMAFESLVIFARTAEGKDGISAFLIEKDDVGRKSVPLEQTLGMRSAGTAEIFFENCEVPAERLIGEEGAGLRQAMQVLNDGRVVLGAMCVGIAQASLEAAVSHAKGREAFGRPVSDFAGLRGMMAESAIDIATSREMVVAAAKMRDAGGDNRGEVAMAKLFASEACLRVCDRGIQIHGGYGYIDETPAGMFWRDARVFTLGEGTSEVHRDLVCRYLFDS
ncbi:MAG: acyl-CoA dehydrogenase family protein [Nitrospinae bacterium]|nr:acyl-CoA dehydrogenase family protein [Nitrospinota bacterium]